MSNNIPVRSIIEDLLPLYNEDLLSEETKKWMDEEIRNNKEFEELVEYSQVPIEIEEVVSDVDEEKLLQKINRKLAYFQIIFVGFSFLLALSTSILNESFGFILSYTVLGVVTFLFYKDIKIAFIISFFPIFLWSLGENLFDYMKGNLGDDVKFLSHFFLSLMGSAFLSIIHYVFALVGNLIGWLILKVKE